MPPKRKIAKGASHLMSLRDQRRRRNIIRKMKRAILAKKLNKRLIIAQRTRTVVDNDDSPSAPVSVEQISISPTPARPRRSDTPMPTEREDQSPPRNCPVSSASSVQMVSQRPDLISSRTQSTTPMVVCSSTSSGMFLGNPGNMPSSSDGIPRTTFTQSRPVVHRYQYTIYEPGPSRYPPQQPSRVETQYMSQNQWPSLTDTLINNIMNSFQAVVPSHFPNCHVSTYNSAPMHHHHSQPHNLYSNRMSPSGASSLNWAENMAQQPVEYLYTEPSYLPNEDIISIEEEEEEEEGEQYEGGNYEF